MNAAPTKTEAQKVLGACIRALREQRKVTLEQLALQAGITYQYLSGVETGKENFTIQVLEKLSAALDTPLNVLVTAAYHAAEGYTAPVLDDRHFRKQVPLPEGLTISHIRDAANLTQSIIHRMNRNMIEAVGMPLQNLIQGNNFSGLVSNIFSNCMDQCSPYKHNHDQKYPDLIYKKGNKGKGIGLEVKLTVNVGKGGESHNGHSGWHVIACYNFLESGDISFVHLMVAILNGHQSPDSDWSYVGSKVNAETGGRRTETYTTNGFGTTKLRDGSVYIDTDIVNFSRWKQSRKTAEIPAWSIFAKN
ncbi:MAG: helix-turn-helix transcriptional regulator [Sulfuritalea sp.]|nr:helix-turn-helix transcriptional regulator [Sulfuritalea sp.]